MVGGPINLSASSIPEIPKSSANPASVFFILSRTNIYEGGENILARGQSLKRGREVRPEGMFTELVLPEHMF